MTDSKKFGFQKVAAKGKLDGTEKLSAQDSRTWFRNQAMNVRKMSVAKFQSETTPFQNIENLSTESIGKMYTFIYDPKWKDKLPWYDTFPLVFPIDYKGDRMLGLNMHYLSPYLRARLMDALYTTINNEKYNKSTQLQINYQILKGAAQFKYFKPCLKCYLFDHVRSPFMYIQPNAWDWTLMLPIARFQKASQERVWMDSMYNV